MLFDNDAGSKPGLEIWRIENLHPVRVDESSFGNFHSGDSYIVLHTFKRSATSSSLDMDLFFWLGSKSSQDEQGSAAYRSVELDDHLGGRPVQHREVQHHESAKFLALFPQGVSYLEGGVDSAFRSVDRDAYEPRLFHIKGRRNVRSVQVELTARSLTEDDCFVLDDGLTLYQWNGRSANRYEKFKALELCQKIKDNERGGRAKLVFLESGKEDADSAKFFEILKGSPADVRSAEEAGSDDAVQAEEVSLWRVSDASGALTTDKVATGVLRKEMLDINDVFLVDGGSAVFLWVGKGASPEERKRSMTWGAEYLKQHNRPDWTPLMRLPAGGETPQFKSFFAQWDVEPQAGREEDVYTPKERKLELGALLEKQRAAEEKMISASGEMKIWRIEELKKVEMDAATYGQFYSGDSYILLYKYKNGNRDAALLYFWQGRDSTTDEKAASALLTVELAGELGDVPTTQVRVTQGKEPQHFLTLFKGRMVVRKGGVAGSGSFAARDVAAGSGDVQLFHIRGSNAVDTRAVEVAPVASSLNSGDCFVLLTAATAYVWQGKGSNADEQAVSAELCKSILAAERSIESVAEGAESEAFWTALGGKADYANARHLQSAVVEPRLFAINGRSASGVITVEEILSFSQDDLQQDSVFLLDIGAEVFVWVGNSARAEEKDAALTMAVQFVKQSPSHGEETPIFRVTAGAEPPTFCAQFLGWSTDKAADFRDPYAVKMAQLQAAQADAGSAASGSTVPSGAVAPAVERVDAASLAAASDIKIYSLAELQAGLPPGVQAAKKELHLSPEEFKATLGMEQEAFAKLAGWKQADLKKKAGIF